MQKMKNYVDFFMLQKKIKSSKITRVCVKTHIKLNERRKKLLIRQNVATFAKKIV